MEWLLFFGFMLASLAALYFYISKRDLSLKMAKNYIQRNINRYIIEAQLNYGDNDSLELLHQWAKKINPENIEPGKLKIFKEFVKEL